MHYITIIASGSPDTIVRIVHVLTRQRCTIRAIEIEEKAERQIIYLQVQPHDNITHILKQLNRLNDITNISHEIKENA